MSDRIPAVAGQFYPKTKEMLEAELKKYIVSANKESAIAVVSPHAGYFFSGHVAGAVFSSINIPKNVIILSPNHSGMGASAAIMIDGNWIIPTGKIPINSKLANSICEKADCVEVDEIAHHSEHSLEVQLPFIYYFQPNVSIVPICLSHISFAEIKQIANSIVNSINDIKEDVLIISSSDMNHYEDGEITKMKDNMAIDHVLKLDSIGLLQTCSENRISMCGAIPTAVVIECSRLLGAKETKLIKYANSGDITGDYSAVVGYAGIIIK